MFPNHVLPKVGVGGAPRGHPTPGLSSASAKFQQDREKIGGGGSEGEFFGEGVATLPSHQPDPTLFCT